MKETTKPSKILLNSYIYVYMIFSLLSAFWILSLFEFIMTLNKSIGATSGWVSVLYRLLNDFWAVIIIALLFYPIYLGLTAINKKFGVVTLKSIFILIILAQFALVKYSLTTLINLGADLLGYSIDDIILTVSSTESVSVLSSLSFLIFPAIFLIIYLYIKKISLDERKLSLIFSSLFILFGFLKIIAFEAAETKHKNKLHFLISDIVRFQLEKNDVNSYDLENRNDYPLLKSFHETPDVLSPFFNIKNEKPNIVMIIVEGLGSEFVGDYSYSGFTPFLDSLIPKSLYWENFISTTSRTFGVVPSLLGSLPFGDKGFLEIKNTPSHLSLINVLKSNGYITSFFAGHNSSFDRKINFLEYNGIDNVIDESKFGSEYIKTQANDGGFAWGYPDAEIFKKTLATLDDLKQPRLDVIMTLSNHEPFKFPNKSEYIKKAENILNSKKSFGLDKDEIRSNIDVFSTLLYTDTAIKSFIEGYSKRSDFSNTIFVITGDHRLIPITQKDKLCRYHVPSFIYSPLINRPTRFKSVSSHFDVAPSLMSLLMNNYSFNKLEQTAWIGKGIDTAKNFRNTHSIPLMRYKGKIDDFLYKDYLYSDGEMYKINENFGTYKVKVEGVKNEVDSLLKEFKRLNKYITLKNRIFPDSLNIYINPKIEFSQEEEAFISQEAKLLNFDETFLLAREYAFNKEYKEARILCKYILNELPNHSDARTLYGRMYAWNGEYEEAEFELLNVIKRNPYYNDAYSALLDLYWWSGQDVKSVPIYAKVIKNNVSDPTIGLKLAKAYERLDQVNKSRKIIDSIIQIHPNNEELLQYEKDLE